MIFSAEHKRKLSEVAKLRVGDKNPFFGHKHKPETIANMIAKLKAHRPSAPAIEKFERRIFYSPDGCRLWLGSVNGAGYGSFKPEKHGQTYLAHRFAWEHYNGVIPDGMCVLHRCDVRLCVNQHHLFLGTHKDNTADMKSKGRWRQGKVYRGENSALAKLTQAQVMQIRADYYLGGWYQAELAQKFSVSQSLVSVIVRGEVWSTT